MAYINMRTYEPDFTPIPNIFIDEYLPYANASYVMIYLFMYRHCFSGGDEFSTGDAAGMLNLLESDIINALKYWEQAGLIKIDESTDESLDIDFLQIKPKDKTNEKALKKEPEKVFLQNKAEYSVEEINIYLEKSEDVRKLFSMAEGHLAKLLTYNDMKTIFGLYDWLGLPFDVIDILLTYCVENNKKTMRYIEAVAIDWAENSITTADDAIRYLELVSGDYRRILAAFGQTQRGPNKNEMKYIKKWLKELGISVELAEHACEKTIANTGQAQFKYADKIITDWHKKGIKTIEEAETLDKTFEAAGTPAPAVKKSTSKNKFVNYTTQRKWDFDKLKELEYEYIENDLKGS